MKPEPATYNVIGDPGLPLVTLACVCLCEKVSGTHTAVTLACAGRSSAAMRCCPGRSTPSCVFGREARVCTIAGGVGFKSRHVQRRGDVIAYDDVRMTVWRDWM
jgi:hypothetical protein